MGHPATGLPLGGWKGNGKWRDAGQAVVLHRITLALTVTRSHAGGGINAGMTVPKEAVTSREKIALVGREQFASVDGIVAGVAVLPLTAFHLSAGDEVHLGFSGEEGIHG